MALKQTRRTVSLNRDVYNKALEHANAQGQSLAELVTAGLLALGLKLPVTHRPLSHAQKAQAMRERSRSASKVTARIRRGKPIGVVRIGSAKQRAVAAGEL